MLGFTAIGAGALGVIGGGLFLYFTFDDGPGEEPSPKVGSKRLSVGSVEGSPGVVFSGTL